LFLECVVVGVVDVVVVIFSEIIDGYSGIDDSIVDSKIVNRQSVVVTQCDIVTH